MRALIAGMAIIVSGCGTTGKAAYGPQPVTLSDTHLTELLGTSFVGDDKAHAFSDTLLVSMANFAKDNSHDEVTVTALKSEIVGALIGQSETICSAYLTDILGVRNTTNSSLSISGLVFGAAGPLMSAGSTGPILSAASTFTTNANKALERSFYGDNDLAVVTRSIRANRETQRLAIEDIFANGDVSKYPFGVLYGRVQKFHDSCGLNHGIDTLKAKSQDAIETQEEENAQQAASLLLAN